MVNKKILILTGLLAVGAVAVVVFDSSRGRVQDPRLGQAVLDGAKIEGIDQVVLKKADRSLTMIKGADNLWRIGDGATGFPADAAKLVRLFDDLARASYQVTVAAGKEALGEFGLATPATVELTAKGQAVLALRFGDERQRGGQYVALVGEDQAYLLSQALYLSTDEDQWESKTLLNLAKDQIKSAAFVPGAASGKAPVTLARDKKEDLLKVQGLAPEQKESAAVAGVDGQFGGVSFVKRYDPANEEAKAALAAASRVTVSLFDGRVFELQLGSVGEGAKKYFLKIVTEEPLLKELMARHAFEVPAYVATRFEKGLADFTEAGTKG